LIRWRRNKPGESLPLMSLTKRGIKSNGSKCGKHIKKTSEYSREILEAHIKLLSETLSFQ
jgi:hypothetical protein